MSDHATTPGSTMETEDSGITVIKSKRKINKKDLNQKSNSQVLKPKGNMVKTTPETTLLTSHQSLDNMVKMETTLSTGGIYWGNKWETNLNVWKNNAQRIKSRLNKQIKSWKQRFSGWRRGRNRAKKSKYHKWEEAQKKESYKYQEKRERESQKQKKEKGTEFQKHQGVKERDYQKQKEAENGKPRIEQGDKEREYQKQKEAKKGKSQKEQRVKGRESKKQEGAKEWESQKQKRSKGNETQKAQGVKESQKQEGAMENKSEKQKVTKESESQKQNTENKKSNTDQTDPNLEKADKYPKEKKVKQEGIKKNDVKVTNSHRKITKLDRSKEATSSCPPNKSPKVNCFVDPCIIASCPGHPEAVCR